MDKKCRRDKIAYVMGEYKRGLLKVSNTIKNRKQAIAIAINQANKLCGTNKKLKR